MVSGQVHVCTQEAGIRATSSVMIPSLTCSGVQLQVCRHGRCQDVRSMHKGKVLKLRIWCSACILTRRSIPY